MTQQGEKQPSTPDQPASFQDIQIVAEEHEAALKKLNEEKERILQAIADGEKKLNEHNLPLELARTLTSLLEEIKKDLLNRISAIEQIEIQLKELYTTIKNKPGTTIH